MDLLNRTQISWTVCACVSGCIFISAEQTARVQNDLRHVYPETHTKAPGVTVRNNSEGDRNNKTFTFAYSKAINVDLLLFFHIDKGRGRKPESIICCRDGDVALGVCSHGDVKVRMTFQEFMRQTVWFGLGNLTAENKSKEKDFFLLE